MANELAGKKIAIVATDRFEQSELEKPLQALREAGADVQVIAPHDGEILGMEHDKPGREVKVDHTFDQVKPEDYDALVLPGGVANPDRLRTDEKAVAFVRHFTEAKKPIGAICHGPWTLTEIDGFLRGRTVTSWPSLKTDLKNAGANWVDREVVTDQGLVTSRKPDDLPAFNKKLIEEVREGVHDRSKLRRAAE
jgi:protease I